MTTKTCAQCGSAFTPRLLGFSRSSTTRTGGAVQFCSPGCRRRFKDLPKRKPSGQRP